MVPCTAPPAVEWANSQQVQISVNLIAVAKQQLRFLSVVDRTPALKDRQVLERAIQRYLSYWLPLARDYESRVTLLPPLDCAWVWHCHKLNPVQYAKDCQQLFGKLVDGGGPEPRQEKEAEAITSNLWGEAYPSEPYNVIRAGQHPVEQLQSFMPLENSNTIPYDLMAAIGRQTSFYFQVSRPWMYEDRFLETALERYRGFLHLIKLALEKQRQGGPSPFVVPTYDIDLLWHSHQLCPTAYRADTIKCMGKILDHDDSDSKREAGSKLETSFLDTCEQWLVTFGTVYEHAGSLYRGPEPERVAPPSPTGENFPEVVTGYPVNQLQQPVLNENNRLLSRKTLQVNLVILGAANICPTPKEGRKSYFYVRVTALRKCPALRLTTNPMELPSGSPAQVAWNEGFPLQAEVSTQGLRMELMSYTTKVSGDGNEGYLRKLRRRIPGLKKKPKCLGEVSIDWERDFLHSTAELSLTRTVSVEPRELQGTGSDTSIMLAEPPQLHFSVSITPPTPAPYIFRMLKAPATDDSGLQVAKKVPKDRRRQEGRWITRLVVDHSGRGQFVVRTRWASGIRVERHLPTRVSVTNTEINVHQGALQLIGHAEAKNYQGQSLFRTPREVVISARQLNVESNATHRRWSLCNGAASLNVAKPTSLYAPLDCEIQGNLGYPMRLLSGRWLDYETDTHSLYARTHEKDEAKYLTLVRYTPDAPMGKATALINWQSAAIEVKPEESVVLVVLISTAISVSLLEMNFKTSPSSESKGYPSSGMLFGRRQSSSDGHLGAMLIQRNALSDRWKGNSSNQNMYWEKHNSMAFFYLPWYQMTMLQVYSSGVGGGCGGGACGGACGGGNCGSGGGCGGIRSTGCAGGGCGGCGGG